MSGAASFADRTSSCAKRIYGRFSIFEKDFSLKSIWNVIRLAQLKSNRGIVWITIYSGSISRIRKKLRRDKKTQDQQKLSKSIVMSNLNNSLGLCLLVSALMLLMQLSIADIVTNEVNDNIDSYSKC